ncbi:hypothetical protein D3C87_189990 [compost metagenome]
MLKKLNIVAASSLLSLLALSACTYKTEKIIVEKQAPTNMMETFSKPAEDHCLKASCITIQKSSLGKTFLMLISGKTGGAAPQWYDLKPLVVSFDRSGNKVALLGQNYNSIYEDIRTENFISSFGIVSEDNNSITFDWGNGLETLIVQTPYQIDSPRSGDEPLTESSYNSLAVTGSYIRNIKFDTKNIELEQISRIHKDVIRPGVVSVQAREETLALNIQIRAYDLGQNFKKKEADKSRRVGFFVTKTTRPEMSADTLNLVTKWDIDPARGPIVVRISDTVGPDYIDAVKEGVLYWNHVFGREVLTIETGVKDADATPKDRTIMLRWLKWMDAGAAYAMGQSDPLTGETLRAQVFLPAVFTKVGSADLVRLNGESPVVGNAIACDFTETLRAVNELSREASDSQRLRLAQDSVRSTVAHEMGHALGMRHNFAGSFSAKLSTKDLYRSAKDYLKNPNHPGLETSTSIMDYVSGIDNILMSAKIKTSALSYDKMAMTWAYADDDIALNEKVSGYCSDEDISLAASQGLAIYGCERFDAGNNPLLRKYLAAKEEKDSMVRVLFTSIIGRLYPGDKPDTVEDLDKVLADSQRWSRANFESLKFVQKAIMDVYSSKIPSAAFASRQAIKAGALTQAKRNLDPVFKVVRTAHLKEAGGFAKLVDSFLRDANGDLDLDWYDKQVDQLIASGVIAKGKNLAGREYELSTEDQKKIVDFFRGLSAKNQKALITDVAGLIPMIDKEIRQENGSKLILSALLPAGMISKDEADAMSELILDLVMASKTDITLKVGKDLAQEVKVAKKFYSYEELAPLAPLLSNEGMGFNQDMNRATVQTAVAAEINQVLKVMDPAADITLLKPEEQVVLPGTLRAQGLLSNEAFTWLLSQVQLLQAL